MSASGPKKPATEAAPEKGVSPEGAAHANLLASLAPAKPKPTQSTTDVKSNQTRFAAASVTGAAATASTSSQPKHQKTQSQIHITTAMRVDKPDFRWATYEFEIDNKKINLNQILGGTLKKDGTKDFNLCTSAGIVLKKNQAKENLDFLIALYKANASDLKEIVNNFVANSRVNIYNIAPQLRKDPQDIQAWKEAIKEIVKMIKPILEDDNNKELISTAIDKQLNASQNSTPPTSRTPSPK